MQEGGGLGLSPVCEQAWRVKEIGGGGRGEGGGGGGETEGGGREREEQAGNAAALQWACERVRVLCGAARLRGRRWTFVGRRAGGVRREGQVRVRPCAQRMRRR